MQKNFIIVLLIILIIVLIIFGPIIIIWALNTLFKLGILYNFKTWLATLILSGSIGGSKVSSK